MVKGTKKFKKNLDSFEDNIEDVDIEEEQEPDDEPVKQYKTAIDDKKVKKTVKEAKKSIGGARKLMKLFRAACHVSEDNQTNFDSPSTLTQVLILSLKSLPKIFSKTFKAKNETKSSVLTSYQNLFRSFLSNSLFLLKQVNQESLLSDIYTGLCRVLKYLNIYPDLVRGFIKSSISIWSESSKTGKLLSYQFLRRVLIKNYYDKVATLKILYLNYTKNSKFMNWSNYSNIETMRKCFVDLLGLDMSSSYQVVFTSLRQLSMFLSQTVKNPSSDRIKTIYNWQFLNSFILMAQCITVYQDLKPLVHPLVQIGAGILSLTNIPKYFPLKIHLIRVLISIQGQCGLYIPSISPNICEILMSSSLSKSTGTKKNKDFSFLIAIKASKDQLDSLIYREQLVDESSECLVEHFASISSMVGFPELFLPTKISLKKHCKKLGNLVYREKILHAIRTIQETNDWVLANRVDIKNVKEGLYLSGVPPIREKCEKILKRRSEIVNSKVSQAY